MLSDETLYMLLAQSLGETHLPLPGRQCGKVRDWYALSSAPGRRLLVTTDRLSAFDRNLACIPYKGQALNQIAAWWFKQTAHIIPNHALDTPDPNALVALEVQPFPVEVIVRGYITGVTSTALWYRYALGERQIYGYHFPEGLHKNEALPAPIITPTTKGGPTGHDERLTCAAVTERRLLTRAVWDQIQAAALAIFRKGQAVAQASGLILVDTKYEFGAAPDGRVMLIDEVHTPDSSRFWKADSYPARLAASAEPENFDKEFVRLAYAQRGYRGEGQPPVLPDNVWVTASRRYITLYEMLTGLAFEPGDYPVEPRLIRHLQEAGLVP
jgi:phosphoribosylaminoimidazole-succinocarboxamide synthase